MVNLIIRVLKIVYTGIGVVIIVGGVELWVETEGKYWFRERYSMCESVVVILVRVGVYM